MAGAGIGGLTAAVALHRRGWHVTVCERAPEPPPPAPASASHSTPCAPSTPPAAPYPPRWCLRRSDGTWLVPDVTADMTARYGMPSIAVPRPAFTAALPGPVRYRHPGDPPCPPSRRTAVGSRRGPDVAARTGRCGRAGRVGPRLALPPVLH
ncbi:NAD(P)-binding protein [Streptomyces wuyuanensis]|uniref:NAD(P)-binding protein n=1 Tax=Streptomyces wuyuanensis TaxID=1196353 RepID=UPI0037168845